MKLFSKIYIGEGGAILDTRIIAHNSGYKYFLKLNYPRIGVD